MTDEQKHINAKEDVSPTKNISNEINKSNTNPKGTEQEQLQNNKGLPIQTNNSSSSPKPTIDLGNIQNQYSKVLSNIYFLIIIEKFKISFVLQRKTRIQYQGRSSYRRRSILRSVHRKTTKINQSTRILEP